MKDESMDYLADAVTAVLVLAKAEEDAPEPMTPEEIITLMKDLGAVLMAIADEEGITDRIFALISEKAKEFNDFSRE